VGWCDSSLEIVDETKPKMRASLLTRRGSALAKIGKYESGASDLQAAIALHPAFGETLEADLAEMQKQASMHGK